jgi:hypothetical protein
LQSHLAWLGVEWLGCEGRASQQNNKKQRRGVRNPPFTQRRDKTNSDGGTHCYYAHVRLDIQPAGPHWCRFPKRAILRNDARCSANASTAENPQAPVPVSCVEAEGLRQLSWRWSGTAVGIYMRALWAHPLDSDGRCRARLRTGSVAIRSIFTPSVI